MCLHKSAFYSEKINIGFELLNCCLYKVNSIPYFKHIFKHISELLAYTIKTTSKKKKMLSELRGIFQLA